MASQGTTPDLFSSNILFNSFESLCTWWKWSAVQFKGQGFFVPEAFVERKAI